MSDAATARAFRVVVHRRLLKKIGPKMKTLKLDTLELDKVRFVARLLALWMVLAVVSTASAQTLDDLVLDGAEFGDATELPTTEQPTTEQPTTDMSDRANSLAPPMTKPSFGSAFGGKNLQSSPFGGSLNNLFGPTEPVVTVSTIPESAKLGEIVTVSVRVQVPNGSHTYPINDEAASTTITLSVPPSLETIDDRFVADRAPESKRTAALGVVEQYEGEVTWTKRFRVVGSETTNATVEGQIDYQVCDELCKPYRETFAVDLQITADAVDLSGGYAVRPMRGDSSDPVQFQFELIPPAPAVGEEVILAITMLPDAHWHAGAVGDDGSSGSATVIKLDELVGLEPADDRFFASVEPNVVTVAGFTQQQHETPVTWQRRFVATGDQSVSLTGNVTYQLCKSDEICLPRNKVPFALGASQATDVLAAAAPVTSSFVDREIFAAATQAGETVDMPLWQWFGFAFLGGLILNVMPCVLPVLAIKVMGFVQQAGESRGRILALNLVYSAGVIIVFAVLGILSVSINLGFGEQFQSVPFTVAMCTVVVIAALSLLGVFEIPIPGFLGNAGADHKEGLTGAFLTGVMATVLATPCTGPFIGPLVAGLASQPVWLAFGVWLMLGVGMASPYLVAGFYPRVIEFLPRPGMWMVYFKQISGFVLLGAVVFLMTGIPKDLRLLFLMAMVGVSFGCWIIGTFRPTPRLNSRLAIYGTAFLIAGGVSATAYKLAQPSENELPWQPFASDTLEELIDNGQPVLVDFTADWCLICKQNELTALNTGATREFVEKNNVTTLYADYTAQSPEIKAWLQKFGQSGVPLTVVYPRGGGEPVKLSGPYTQSTLLGHLEDAVGAEANVQIAKEESHELPWQPFESELLQQTIEAGQPVLVDFTADWCLICKQNEHGALNTESTNQFVRRNNVTTLYADYTDESPEIKAWLERFGQSGVPLTVVYPLGGGEPVKLSGPYSQEELLEVLEAAVSDKIANSPGASSRN